MSTSFLVLLVVCILLLLVGAFFLFMAFGMLAVFFRGGRQQAPEVPQASAAPRAPVSSGRAPAPAPPPTPPPTPPPPAKPAMDEKPPETMQEDEWMSPESEDGKTEVFSRGSFSMDWDDEDSEGEATEIFRPDVHGGGFEMD